MKSKGYAIVDVPAMRRDQAEDREQRAFAAVADLDALIGAPATLIPVTHPLGMLHWTAQSRFSDASSWKAAVRGNNDNREAA